MKLNINELANKVNEQLADSTSYDGRQKTTLSERRIRDYLSKNLISKPFGTGKNKWFTEIHINELIALRQLQQSGISEKYIIDNTQKTIPVESHPHIDSAQLNNEYALDRAYSVSKDNDTLMFISSLAKLRNVSEQTLNITSNYRTSTQNKDMMTAQSASPMSTPSVHSNNLFSKGFSDLTRSIGSPAPLKSRTYAEHELMDNSSVVLKIDSSLDLELQKKIINAVSSAIQTINSK